MNIYHISGTYYSCNYAPGIYTVFTNYYQLMVRGIVATLLMLIFGLLTVKNLQNSRRIAPAANTTITRVAIPNQPRQFTQKDRQFILMLYIDLIIYVLCSILRPIYLIYIEATQYQTEDAERQSIELFINSLTLFITFIPTCLGFYTNFIVSKTFRQNVKNFLQAIRICCFYQSN
jgi:hypothetical protein